MTAITLDGETIQKLRAHSGSVQIRDAAGQVVGIFRPSSVHVYAKGETPDFDWKQLKQELNSPEKITTEELKRRLRSRP